jgi:uncharacterized protein YecE (DUF72 family)
VALWVGTSGWQYRDWRGSFYPEALPTTRWLGEYTRTFATVELNNSFYRLPSREAFSRWRDIVPDGFRFAVKASRYLTHIRRLKEPAEPVQRLMDAAHGLGDRLDVVLLQLPPTFRRDVARLTDTLDRFPDGIRIALEVRHDSWFDDSVYSALADRATALCLTDRLNRVGPLVRTAPWCYVRLHEGTASPRPCYGRGALGSWLDRLTELYGGEPDGYVYFNNDPQACAPANARTFRRMAKRRGIDVR